ncbi:MAG: DedA family protein [Gammaproteobacteria bacterium]|nr:DedA family protein [Gammaproteobacteria bacterium]
MKLFAPLYERVISWSKHPQALKYLGVLSFAESSFFPIPPDVMLAPMSLVKPDKALYYALITTIASVIGGMLGYFIGSYFYDNIAFLITEGGRWFEKYEHVKQWFDQWGVYAIFIAGFSPIPYKVFTITAGILQMAFIPFVVASFIGRGLRFFLVAGLMKWGGKRMEDKIAQYVEQLGWAVVIIFAIAFTLYYLFK